MVITRASQTESLDKGGGSVDQQYRAEGLVTNSTNKGTPGTMCHIVRQFQEQKAQTTHLFFFLFGKHPYIIFVDINMSLAYLIGSIFYYKIYFDRLKTIYIYIYKYNKQLTSAI